MVDAHREQVHNTAIKSINSPAQSGRQGKIMTEQEFMMTAFEMGGKRIKDDTDLLKFKIADVLQIEWEFAFTAKGRVGIMSKSVTIFADEFSILSESCKDICVKSGDEVVTIIKLAQG